MTILGIESSCDDTSVALLEASENRFFVLSEKTADQIDIHKKFGGVVPEIAGRMHAEKIMPLVEEVLQHATCNMQHATQKPDVIAVTAGPGLMTGLMVGVEAAKALSYLWDVPVVGVNHIEGHVYSVLLKDTRDKIKETRDKIQDSNKFQISNFKFQNIIKTKNSKPQFPISNFQFPALCLIVSGGHTEIIFMKDHGRYELIGKTRDDAAGEAFDKAAKLLGLEYPGGPKISKLAAEGNANAIPFPRPMISATGGPASGWDFSFAGLKTAALYWLRDNTLSATRVSSMTIPSGISGVQRESPTVSDFCASFEQAIVDVLVTKTIRAAKQFKPKTLILAGGVSANEKLRKTLAHSAGTIGYELLAPNVKYAMDNAAMIAVAGYFHAVKRDFTPWQKLEADANWKIYES